MTDNIRYDASYKVAWRVFQSRKGREKLRKVAHDRSKFIDKMDGLLTAAYRMEKIKPNKEERETARYFLLSKLVEAKEIVL